MAETWTVGEIVLCAFAASGCIAVVVLFFKALDIPPECCAPSNHHATSSHVDVEVEGIQ